jgi:hypothetical protein
MISWPSHEAKPTKRTISGVLSGSKSFPFREAVVPLSGTQSLLRESQAHRKSQADSRLLISNS